MKQHPTRLTRRQLVGGITILGSALLAGCSGQDDPPSTPEDEEEIDPGLRLNRDALNSSFPIELLDPDSGDVIASVHWHGERFSHWHFGPLEIFHGEQRTVQVAFNDWEGDRIPLGPNETYQLSVYRSEETPSELLETDVNGELVDIHGESEGEGQLFFQLEHDGEDVWLSPPLQTVVG